MGIKAAAAILLLSFAPSAASAEADVWTALKSGGHVALIRHAEAPGTDDPPGFRIDDCATQRNLSEAGREQARGLGARFREHGIESARVYSSRWCRCLDTAGLLGLGKVTPFPGLDSFFRDRSRRERQTAEVKALLREFRGGPSLILVTHRVNITALSGAYPQSGEIVVLRNDGEDLPVIGRIR